MSNSRTPSPKEKSPKKKKVEVQNRELKNDPAKINDKEAVETENETISKEEFMLVKKQNDELNTKVADFESMVKRQQAEFENYRKRTIREKEEFGKYAIIPVIKDLLSVADNFERALKVEVDEHNQDFIKGFEMINKQLLDLFAKHGVMAVDGLGHAFDPSFHQAIQFEEKEDHDLETVAEVYQKGYKLDDRVIRTATVKIYKPISAKAEAKPTADQEHSQLEIEGASKANSPSVEKTKNETKE